MNIYEKLLKVKESVKYLKKENEGFQYKFVSSSQVISSLREEINNQKLLLVPDVENARFTDILRDKNTKGNETVDLLTELYMTFKWVNTENPEETLSVKWYGQGVDTNGEKGVGKAYTYAEKYFLLKFFNIPTDKDDPDFFQEKQQKKSKSGKQKPSPNAESDAGIIAGVDSLNSAKEISDYFNEHNAAVKNKSEFVKAINSRRKAIAEVN